MGSGDSGVLEETEQGRAISVCGRSLLCLLVFIYYFYLFIGNDLADILWNICPGSDKLANQKENNSAISKSLKIFIVYAQ